jgi:hypothetical protein
MTVLVSVPEKSEGRMLYTKHMRHMPILEGLMLVSA